MATTEHYDLDTDTLLGGASASDLIISSQKAIKDYIDSNTSEIFVATYGTTTYQEITDALVAGKYPICEVMGAWGVYSSSAGHKHNFTNYYNGVLQNLYVNSSNVWNYEELMPADKDLSNLSATGETHFQAPLGYTPADTTLSNVSSIDANSAVQTALDGKVNKSGVDGQWVFSYHEIIANGTINSGAYIEHSLSSYLPNDGFNYEILFALQGNTGSTAGNSAAFNVSSDYNGYAFYGMAVAKGNTNVNGSTEFCGSAIFPIGTGRKIYISNTGNSTAQYVYGIIQAYRRLGTNS